MQVVEKNTGRTHNEKDCVRIVGNLRGVSVISNNKLIIRSKSAKIGSKCWGRIDYLVGQCGFRVVEKKEKRVGRGAQKNPLVKNPNYQKFLKLFFQ